MLSSLFTGITGLNVSGTAMSLIGDNLANNLTPGFKRSRAVFSELIAQKVAAKGAGSSLGMGAGTSCIIREFTQAALANSNRPLDMGVNGRGFFHVQNRINTENNMIGTASHYTRAGNFALDRNGFVAEPSGYLLQGWSLDPVTGQRGAYGNLQIGQNRLDGEQTDRMNMSLNLNPNATTLNYSNHLPSAGQALATTNISPGGVTAVDFTIDMSATGGPAAYTVNVSIPQDTTVEGASTLIAAALGNYGTTSVYVSAGDTHLAVDPADDLWTITAADTSALDLDTMTQVAIGTPLDPSDINSYHFTTSTDIHDEQGNPHAVNVYFRKSADNTWNWTAVASDSTTGYPQTGQMTFASDGTMLTGDPGAANFDFVAGAATQTIAMDFTPMGNYGATTQNGNTYVSYFVGQDGYSPGSLEELSVSESGEISGLYSNGEKLALAMIGLSRFQNDQGLARAGSGLYTETVDSGDAVANPAMEGGNGVIFGNALETSNVDVAQEFVDMIMAQRSFQANSKVISTSDQLLSELMNIRR